jgi:hypothetical protein
MQVETHFGEVKINGINKTFHNIDLIGEYTDVYIHVDPSISCSIEISHNSQTEIVANVDAHLKKENINQSKQFKSTGYIGNSTNTSKINISSTAGKITITQ